MHYAETKYNGKYCLRDIDVILIPILSDAYCEQASGYDCHQFWGWIVRQVNGWSSKLLLH